MTEKKIIKTVSVYGTCPEGTIPGKLLQSIGVSGRLCYVDDSAKDESAQMLGLSTEDAMLNLLCDICD